MKNKLKAVYVWPILLLVVALIISIKVSDTVHDGYFGDVKKTESKSEEGTRIKQGTEQKDSIILIHFKSVTNAGDITAFKNFLDKQEGINSIIYTSAEEELARFKERHKDDAVTLKVLSESGKNPLGATFELKLNNSSNRENILKMIKASTQFSKIEGII